ncbi:nucleotide exchange factor GrpE [Candidatus Parcubacteria bacterium]|nr:nucleotide exchange factor GrpE [Candidatus Parcubacteria bacterium]
MDDHMTDGQEPKNQEMVSDVKEELEQLTRERDEYLAGWQRAKADFINFKRDAEKLAGEVQKFAREDFIYQLLPVLDHFMFAEAHLPDERRQDDWVKGVFQIKSELEDILKREGVEVMEAMGKPFNPECHESLGALETDGPENVVVDELQRGYVLNGRVLRPAKVKISVSKVVTQ